MSAGLIFALVCALLAIAYGVFQSGRILRLPEGNERMREISLAIREGAVAYLWRQYKTIAIVGVILFLVIGFVAQPSLGTKPITRNRITPTMAMVRYRRQK